MIKAVRETASTGLSIGCLSGIPPFFSEPNFDLHSITSFLYIWPSFVLDNQRNADSDNLCY
ncbi:MAG: hypothetical protein PHR32_06395, partial [Candidatus Cloacimonetes bacterium]|nr:hypothetical protein [Candidatus Cloacimonadota bacterium]